jgi:hypothetical protein
MLKKHLRSMPSQESRARYSPSKHAKYIKVDVLRRYRFVYTLMFEGKTRREMAPELMKLRKFKQLPTFRAITRNLTAAKQILKDVATGVFPSNVDERLSDRYSSKIDIANARIPDVWERSPQSQVCIFKHLHVVHYWLQLSCHRYYAT